MTSEPEITVITDADSGKMTTEGEIARATTYFEDVLKDAWSDVIAKASANGTAVPPPMVYIAACAAASRIFGRTMGGMFASRTAPARLTNPDKAAATIDDMLLPNAHANAMLGYREGMNQGLKLRELAEKHHLTMQEVAEAVLAGRLDPNKSAS